MKIVVRAVSNENGGLCFVSGVSSTKESDMLQSEDDGRI